MKPTSKPNFPNSLKYLVVFISVAAFTLLKVHAQDVFTRANKINEDYKQEKIYLHIDRPSYWANEDLWFKAYLKDSPKANCNLYVELLNEKGAIVCKNICWVQNGLSYGDMHLADTLSSGMYQLRAYTNWMRNFDEQCFFRRDLLIWNLRDKARPSHAEELKARKVDFRFMPEGGTFLAGIKNRVAFKAIDSNGKGLDVKGVILDDKGKQVAMIKSDFKGMGSFEIIPEPGKKYSAELTVAGEIPLKEDLPQALATGVTLSFDAKDTSHIHLEVHEKGNVSKGNYQIIAQSEGKVSYQGEVSVKEGIGVINIDKEKFPTGIVRFTLFDTNNLPRCERLVFVNHHDQVTLRIEAEEQEYHPREKVTLDISALDKDENPLFANLSISAYHTETIQETEKYPENILSRFLLTSELKGKVEEPAYYFKDDSLSTILALDNLMLTHGYRYFEWKQVMENKLPTITFQPDSGIQLKGTVLSDLLHKPVPNAKVTMMTVKSLLSLQEQTSDSAGHFTFSNLFFNGILDVVLQMQKKNGKAVSGLQIDFNSSNSPQVTILPLTYNYSQDNSVQTVSYMSDLSPEFLNRKWRLTDTILLGDVNVKAWKSNKWKGIPRPYLDADAVIDVTKLDNVYFNLLETLEMNSPLYRSFMQREAKFFIDGVFDRFGLIEDVTATSVDKVEFLRMTYRPGFGYGPGIFVYLKRGNPYENIEYSPGIRPATLTGFSVIRKYYSPNYDEKDNKQNEKNDFRSSLYWNPVLTTDSEGVTWVSFYNSDQLGDVQVVVEGVTKEGKICRGVYKYTVVPDTNKDHSSAF
jgi:hypothetical protein